MSNSSISISFEQSETDYKKYSILYKRNYILYGPSGTGKTSLTNVLANELKRSIYIILFDANLIDS